MIEPRTSENARSVQAFSEAVSLELYLYVSPSYGNQESGICEIYEPPAVPVLVPSVRGLWTMGGGYGSPNIVRGRNEAVDGK